MPDERLARKGAIKSETTLREYDRQAGTARDWVLGQSWSGYAFRFAQLLQDIVERSTRQRLVELVVE
jgi:hypothetical protein